MVTSQEIIDRAIQKEDPAGAFLNHHGVKGMKWGVRRRGAAGVSKKPKAHELSDEDLRKHIERMNLEKQYTQLSKKKSYTPESQEFVKALGKTVITSVVTSVVAKQVGKAMVRRGL